MKVSCVAIDVIEGQFFLDLGLTDKSLNLLSLFIPGDEDCGTWSQLGSLVNFDQKLLYIVLLKFE
jgi:hypothetical protein